MKRKKLYIVFGIVLVILAVVFVLQLLPHIPKKSEVEESIRSEVAEYESEHEGDSGSGQSSGDGKVHELDKERDESQDQIIAPWQKEVKEAEGKNGNGEDGEYISPIDFEKLQAACPDAYAWLSVPGTDISYPIVQSQSDDTFYLKHSATKANDSAGAIFTEHTYNKKDFTDPVTVMYGHKMRAGTMFGELQEEYSSRFQDIKDIYIYLPDRVLKYKAFAAIPYGDQHLLGSYDFTDPGTYKLFFDEIINTRKLGSTIDTNGETSVEFLTAGDEVIVLSTCTYQYDADRFLVMAKLEK